MCAFGLGLCSGTVGHAKLNCFARPGPCSTHTNCHASSGFAGCASPSPLLPMPEMAAAASSAQEAPAATVTPLKRAADSFDSDIGSSSKRKACAIFRFAERRPGHEQDDEALERCAQELVRCMWEDKSLVMPLYSVMTKRRDEKSKRVESDGSGTFLKFGTICSLEPDWVLNYLHKMSRIPVSTLLKCKELEDGALISMFPFDCQLGHQAPLSSPHGSGGVCNMVFAHVFVFDADMGVAEGRKSAPSRF